MLASNEHDTRNDGARQTISSDNTIETISIPAKMTILTLRCRDVEKRVTFTYMPEKPVLTAASALAEVRTALRELIQPGAITELADEVVTLLEGSGKKKFKHILQKLLPLLQAESLQRKLYGDIVRVEGNDFVKDTVAKELQGTGIHLTIAIEALRKDPIILAKILPYIFDDEDDDRIGNGRSSKHGPQYI